MHTVHEAMTMSVITVAPDTSVTAAARIMRDAGVSGLPVVDPVGRVVGMLTEADLLTRAVLPELDDASTGHSERGLPVGSTVADLMSRDVIGVRPTDPLAKAARLMDKARVRRLVVVGDGFTLQGIISRRDVVAALARPDADIEEEIRSEVVERILGLEPQAIQVSVEEGVVRLAGEVAHRREAVRLERLARSVLGVSAVDSEVTWLSDAEYASRTSRFAFFTERKARDGGRADSGGAT